MAMAPQQNPALPEQEPQPSLGEVLGRAQTRQTHQQSEGFMANVQGLLEAFERPDVQAGLLQAGARLLQPLPVGQTLAGQIGVAISEGAEAADRVRAYAREDQARAHKQAQEERRTAVQERQADVAESAEERLRSQGERRLDLTEEELKQTRSLKERQLELQAELGRAKNDIDRGRIIASLSENQARIESQERRIRAQVDAQLKNAEENRKARVAVAASNALLFYPEGTPLSTVIKDMNAGISTADANRSALQGAFPEDVRDIPDETFANAAADPRRMAVLLGIYTDPAEQNYIRQKLYEARQKTQVPETQEK